MKRLGWLLIGLVAVYFGAAVWRADRALQRAAARSRHPSAGGMPIALVCAACRQQYWQGPVTQATAAFLLHRDYLCGGMTGQLSADGYSETIQALEDFRAYLEENRREDGEAA